MTQKKRDEGSKEVYNLERPEGGTVLWEKLKDRQPEFLDRYPLKEGAYGLQVSRCDVLELMPSRVRLWEVAIQAGKNPAELGLGTLPQGIVTTMVLHDRSGQVVAQGSSFGQISGPKALEMLESNALNRVLANTGFRGDILEKDELADMVQQGLTVRVVPGRTGESAAATPSTPSVPKARPAPEAPPASEAKPEPSAPLPPAPTEPTPAPPAAPSSGGPPETPEPMPAELLAMKEKLVAMGFTWVDLTSEESKRAGKSAADPFYAEHQAGLWSLSVVTLRHKEALKSLGFRYKRPEKSGSRKIFTWEPEPPKGTETVP